MRRMILPTIFGVLVVIASLLPAAATSADSSSGADRAYADTLARYASQPIRWAECYPGYGVPELQCATLRAPRDWANPRRGDLDVVMSRVKASNPGARRGVLLLNPGGPGVGGINLPYAFETLPVASVYDLIGFDPRGVGRSGALECASPAIVDRAYRLDGRDTSLANTLEFVRLSQRWGQECSADPQTRDISTSQIVRDMDLMRAVLGERKINYFGYSWGSWLGAWYASTFPNRTDRFALDGNFDWTGTSYDGFSPQVAAFQHSYEHDLLPWIAKYDATYHLGSTPSRVKANIEARRSVLQAHPMVLEPGNAIDGAAYDEGLASALYGVYSYPFIAEALAALEHWRTATAAERDNIASWFYGGSVGHGDDPFYTLLCSDTPSPPSSVTVADWLRDRTRYPLIGSTYFNPCPSWSIAATGSPVVARDVPALLMLANDGDPATPYAGALHAHRAAPNTRLITVRDEPDHTIYGAGVACVDDAVNAWLIDGVLPRRDLTCQGQALPTPNVVATAATRTAAAATTASPYQRQRASSR